MALANAGGAFTLYNDLAVFSGRAHPELAGAICGRIGRPLGKVDVFEFSNENLFVQYQENIRQRDVFLVQPFCSPVNTSIMELLIMIDAAKRASAGRITAVIPYYAYGRSDKKDQPRVPITARLIANLIESAGCDRILTQNLHAGQIQGFFNIPVDELNALYPMSAHFRAEKLENFVVVAPDVGDEKRARDMAQRLDLPLAIIEQYLFKRGTVFDAAELRQAPVRLANWDIIDSGGQGHRFSVPMIGLWIRRNRPLADLTAQSQLVSPRAWRYYEIAALSAQRELWDEAIADFQLALQANPAMVEAHLGLAAACRARNGPGDLAVAIETYERALDLDPAVPRKAMLEVLAQAIDDSGQAVDEQLRLFGRIQALDAGGEFQSRAMRALAHFANLRMQSLKTVDGADRLFRAVDDGPNAELATRMTVRKKRLEVNMGLALFVANSSIKAQ